ncbi:MAG: folylpolyglutamate synthase/dihydrofolate synthase family protein [Flavobacteriales bacterium]
MDYQETLAYLYARLPMYQRIGKAAYKADLSNTWALMDVLEHPERELKCVHVAGTNGKGSTAHMVASILQEAGYKVGLHTSPHLKDFRERFRLNGRMIGEDVVVRFVERYRSGFEPVQASFFEWGVGLALWWFREEEVDIAVIETGMGGRLDSTNVVGPEVSVITSIGLDHAEFLGRTEEAIATEKAGIIKQGVPVVVGEVKDSVSEVIRARAREKQAAFILVDSTMPLPGPLDLAGAHQLRNARTACTVADTLTTWGWSIPPEAIRLGLSRVVRNTGLMGRWQVLNERPMIVADVAHNRDGFRVVSEQLGTSEFERLHIVLGVVNDKDLSALRELPKEATYYFCKADIPRGLEVEELKRQAAAFGLKGTAHPSVAAALLASRSCSGPDDLILITGSVFVVAEVI